MEVTLVGEPAAFQAHLFRLGLWGGASMVIGVLLWWRAAGRAGHRQAALHCTLWGAINVALVVAGLRGAPPSAAFLWLNVGLDVGYAGVAATLVLVGRRYGASALQGAGWAILPQGVMLALLDLIYLAARGDRLL